LRWKKEILRDICNKAQELERKLSDPAILKDPQAIKSVSRSYQEIKPAYQVAKEILEYLKEIEDIEKMLTKEKDPELWNYLKDEIHSLRKKIESLEEELAKIFSRPDMESEQNALVEIRAGAGGEEAALFAKDLFKMYMKYAEKRGWKVSLTDYHETPLGGFKEVTFLVEGKGAYGELKFESGVHRVQRVPITESGGRIHTSTASVVVLPETEDVEVEIKPDELKIETFRAGGPGGQHVNVTDSAVRITHIPTGITVTCQDERSQHKNKAKALRILKARLNDFYREKREREETTKRRSYIGSGDRSEKIRTYNFPQGRVTDHRIGLTLYNLEEIMEGELDILIEALKKEEERKKMEEINSSSSEEK